MWPYLRITREDFENRKDFVEKVLQQFGCEEECIKLPYYQSDTTYGKGFEETHISDRPIYRWKNQYIRIGEVLLEKPCIVLEIAETRKELMGNSMEDTDPFWYDLTDEEIIEEVRLLLEIEKSPPS